MTDRDRLPSQFSALFQPGANGGNPSPADFGGAFKLDLAFALAI